MPINPCATGGFRPHLTRRCKGAFGPLQRVEALLYAPPFANHVRLFLGSSAVEHSTVNRMVAGSNPARGANEFSWLVKIHAGAGRRFFSRGHSRGHMSDKTVPVTPRVFISYSWTSPNHERWVMDLATQLVESGVDVILDKWNLREGNHAYKFMESMVTDSKVTKVIIVSDKRYAEKADNRKGGLGAESQRVGDARPRQLESPGDRRSGAAFGRLVLREAYRGVLRASNRQKRARRIESRKRFRRLFRRADDPHRGQTPRHTARIHLLVRS
jgi:hypothetical protein